MRREDSPGVAGEGVDSARAVRDRGLDTVTIAQRHNTTQVLHLAAAEMVRHDVERAGDEEDHLLARVTPQDRELSLGAGPDVEHLILANLYVEHASVVPVPLPPPGGGAPVAHVTTANFLGVLVGEPDALASASTSPFSSGERNAVGRRVMKQVQHARVHGEVLVAFTRNASTLAYRSSTPSSVLAKMESTGRPDETWSSASSVGSLTMSYVPSEQWSTTKMRFSQCTYDVGGRWG